MKHIGITCPDCATFNVYRSVKAADPNPLVNAMKWITGKCRCGRKLFVWADELTVVTR